MDLAPTVFIQPYDYINPLKNCLSIVWFFIFVNPKICCLDILIVVDGHSQTLPQGPKDMKAHS